MYRIFHAPEYDYDFHKQDGSNRAIIIRFEERLKEDQSLGKPIWQTFLFEKKIHNLRVYYLIFDQLQRILLVKISTKKLQQHDINFIKEHFEEYKEYVRRL